MNSTFPPYQTLNRAFPGISENEAAQIIAAGTLQVYPAGEILCHEGALETTFYILLTGEVRVTKRINEGQEKVLNTLYPGDFFGEMAILHQAPRAATITAISPVRVMEIDKTAFTNLVKHNSSISLSMIREVSNRLRQNDEMAIEDLRSKASELARAYQQLADLEQARREFLTTIAHELRTPLMAANGFIEAMRMGMLPDDSLQTGLSTVAQNLQEIIILTNNILFMQEMDLILPTFQPVLIDHILNTVVANQQEHARQMRVELQWSTPPSLPAISGDPKSLERAFTAVLDNAIKFSPEGGKVVITCQSDKGQRTPVIEVNILDHGVGIPPEALPHIFDRFFHMDEMGGYLFRGAGLGLSIARQVIQQHQGEIKVTSTPGEGSRFRITLPLPSPINT